MPDSEYNAISRFLHRIALQANAIPEMSFELENNLIKKKISFSNNHVFVSGLARSGTTILMRYLYETGQFGSLTYSDMPFVLMPRIWKSLSFLKKSTAYKERAHKDGIQVNYESPEAFEEVFWKVFCGKDYILGDRLCLHDVSSAVLEKFRNYVCNILAGSDSPAKTRYLSKNNNNVLRCQYIRKAFPGSFFVIPFRDPLQHALSLLQQHIHFSKMQLEDKFTLDYMTWLGHHEFGLNQKPFYLNNDEVFQQMNRLGKTELNFWLLNWKNYYSYAINQFPENSFFVSHEKLCSNPHEILSRLWPLLHVDMLTTPEKSFLPPDKTVQDYDENLLLECKIIYKNLEEKFFEWFERVPGSGIRM